MELRAGTNGDVARTSTSSTAKARVRAAPETFSESRFPISDPAMAAAVKGTTTSQAMAPWPARSTSAARLVIEMITRDVPDGGRHAEAHRQDEGGHDDEPTADPEEAGQEADHQGHDDNPGHLSGASGGGRRGCRFARS